MREEFGEDVSLSVLSLRLVPWRIQVLSELASDISLYAPIYLNLVATPSRGRP